MSATRRLALLVGLLACSRGGTANTPAAVADRFIDLYVIEVNQQLALALTTGNAHRKLEEEIADVAGVRSTGYMPADAKAAIYYERIMLRQDGDTARAVYALRIKQGHEEHRRQVLLSLDRREGGVWKVAGYFLQDEPAAPE